MVLSSDENDSSSSAKWLVKFLVQTYFLNLNSILVVFDSQNRNEIQDVYLTGIEECFLNTEGIVIQLLNVAPLNHEEFQEKMLDMVELGTEGFISILPNASRFLEARYYATETSTSRLKDKFHLYLQDSYDVANFFTEENLKLYPWHVLVTKENETYNFWTQKFFGTYGHDEPVLLSTFFENSTTFEKSVDLYPDKMKNLQGKVIRVGSIYYAPYVMFDSVTPGTGNVNSLESSSGNKDLKFTGSEATLIMEFCVLRNCSYNIKNYGRDVWGTIYENGTTTGLIGGVYRKEVEFGIGSIYNWFNDEFEVSNCIAKSAVRIMGPAPQRYPTYLTPVLPLTAFVWMVLFLSMIICSFVLNELRCSSQRLTFKTIRYGESLILAFLDIYAIFLQQGYSENHSNRFGSRFFLAMLLISGLTLENCYSGQLKSLLTVPLFEDAVDTKEKYAKSNYKWGSLDRAWVESIQDSDLNIEKIIANNFEIHSADELKKLTYSGSFGFPVEKLHSGGYTFGDYLRDGKLNALIVMKNDLFLEYTRIISVRGWPIKPLYDTIILWSLESGLFEYWERMYVARYLDSKSLNYILRSESGFTPKPEPEVILISHISGPIFALLFGYLLSAFVFLCEYFFGQFRQKYKY